MCSIKKYFGIGVMTLALVALVPGLAAAADQGASMGEHVAMGTVSNLTSSTLTLKTDDGQTIDFPVTQSLMQDRNIQRGDRVEIHFTGSQSNPSRVTKVELESQSSQERSSSTYGDDQSSSQSSQDTMGNEQKVEGTVTSVTSSNLELRTDDGRILDLPISQSTLQGRNVNQGDRVEVEFTGTKENPNRVTSIDIENQGSSYGSSSSSRSNGRLPQTASLNPLVGLIGLTALAGALAIGVLKRF